MEFELEVEKLATTPCNITANELEALLTADSNHLAPLFSTAAQIKTRFVGNKVYFRGLIEFSNRCAKDCLYCGIRCSNSKAGRYELSDQEVIDTARLAADLNFGSIVIQAGERTDKQYIRHISSLLEQIHAATNNTLGITLSLGEQSEETYRLWFESGATRYLLRIETSNEQLYKKLHPNNANHSFATRLNCLELLQKAGFQTGTGVMIGLPFQTEADLARDLLFMRDFDIDMVGMGPYIEHADTPLYAHSHLSPPVQKRFDLTIRMIALLRVMMKDVNIASTTALQAIRADGREAGLRVGANVMMPNLTPLKYQENYFLYQNKPRANEHTLTYIRELEASILRAGDVVAYGEKGNPLHFYSREKK